MRFALFHCLYISHQCYTTDLLLFMRFYYGINLKLQFLARDAFVRTNRRAIAMMLILCPSVRLSVRLG